MGRMEAFEKPARTPVLALRVWTARAAPLGPERRPQGRRASIFRNWIRITSGYVLSCLLVTSGVGAFAQGARVAPSGAGEAADDDNPAARDQWFLQGRLAPRGQYPADLRWQAYRQKIQMRAARMLTARQALGVNPGATLGAASTGWSPLGPSPLKSDPGSGQDYGFVSGRATSVAIDPADPTGNTVYIGGAYGGVWRSQNAAGLSSNPNSVSWTAVTDTQPTLSVGAIALQPCRVSLGNCDGLNHLTKTILVGTGEPNSALDSYYGLGILRSVDAGNTWTLISSAGANSFKGLGFSRIAFNATSGKENQVVAAAASTIGNEDGARANGQIAGPFVSQDSGLNCVSAPVSDGTFGGLVAPISATSVVYNTAAGAFYMAMRYHGFYSSTDGTSWTRLAAQPAPAAMGINSSTTCPTAASTNCPFYRGEIAVVPNRNEMYVWYTDGNDADQGIWRSTDGGGSWTKLNDANITNCGDPSGCGTVQGFYDLELAAAPNGSSTDLYAGARNLFKCTIPSTVTTSTCSGTGASSFQNLTHVYNCSGHPAVHPDQHGIASMIVNGTDVLYFANDGGIYRALDGFTVLASNSCLNNQFGNLNGQLGSMTQFVSFSEDSANSAILLGGTQDNGSPSASQPSTNWQSVNGGDGGYNEIDPVDPNNWYTANTDISIQRCTSGVSCTQNSFALVVDSAHLGGDSGAFYTPYILDPQNSGELIVGTCRVWRGTTTGSGVVAISPNFDAGFASICADPKTSVVNYVHAIAAGGPIGANGFSKVVYAGLAGFGPISGTSPAGGRVFVTSDSTANSIVWSEITPPANQATFYTVGDIVIDASDATGATAYLALEGFGSSHVLKTTNANLGTSTTWMNFSGTLPNAPANSLAVDPTSSTIYVGTDVGVFSSPTGSPAWSEVGPAPSPAASGYLPNAPVTKLRMFSNLSGTKLLRASTYGRGIWEYPLAIGTPDFTLTVPTSALTSYPNQTVPYNGTLTSVNGDVSPVNLSCTGGHPAACAPVATPVTPVAAPGAAFVMDAAHGTIGDFAFTIHAVDGAVPPVVHDTNATLHVVDFAATAPNPATVTANIPNTSDATTFQITAQGSFADAVTLTCSNGLPAGAACNFSPSATVQPTLAFPATVTLTVSTDPTTPAPAASTITIQAHDAANPEPAPKTQTLTLNATASPDFALAISNSTLAITVQGSATFNGTLTAVNGYIGGVVKITCGPGKPSTCPPLAPITLPAQGSMNFSAVASSSTVGTFNFDIHGDDNTTTHDAPVSLTINADFHVPATTVTCTAVTAGGVSTCSIPIGPDGQATFAGNVTYQCGMAGFPNLSFCSFNPASILAGTAATTVILSVQTTAATAALGPAGQNHPANPLLALWLSLPTVGILALGRRRSGKRLAYLAGTALLLALVSQLAACGGKPNGGGGGQPGTNQGTYTFNVDATSNGITHSAQMSVTVN